MQDACRDVSRMLDLQRHGGTLIQRDSCTAILVDHELVTFHALETISTLHPNLQISTQACAESTSGFMVMFVYKPYAGVLFSANTVVCVCVCACLLWSVVLVCLHVSPHTLYFL